MDIFDVINKDAIDSEEFLKTYNPFSINKHQSRIAIGNRGI